MWSIVRRRQVGQTSYRIKKDGKTEHVSFERELGLKSRGGDFCYTIDFAVTPHVLRHTYITNLILGGTDLKTVQYLAGHADPKITLKIYTHIKKDSKKQVRDQVNSVFGVKNEVKQETA